AITPTAAPTAATASGVCSTSSSGTAPSSTNKAFRRCPMRILWLKTDLLLPLDKGGKLRTWHLMRHLAKRHEITYLAFAEPGQPQSDVDGMKEVAARVETITRSDPAKGTWRFYADAAAHVVDRLPYAVGKYRSADFRRRFDSLVAAIEFDLIVCDFLF